MKTHLTKEQRYTISVLKNKGQSITQIAKIIGKHKSTVSRELKRNADKRNGQYDANLAHKKYLQRMKEKPKKIKFTPLIQEYVVNQIRNDLSPEQIVGLAKKEGKECVSHERIYQFIWKDKKKGGDLHLHLRRKGKKYRKRRHMKDSRGRIRNRVDIEHRPKIVEEKVRFGDFEVDTIIGQHHKGVLLTILERKTGFVIMRKLPSKDASVVAQTIIDALLPFKGRIHTITSDNGKEFAEHPVISQKLGISFYFAKPYQSWQRGAIENVNGLIRQYFPKKTNFSLCSDDIITTIQNKLNNRPRKRLNFETPIKLFNYFCNQHSNVALVT